MGPQNALKLSVSADQFGSLHEVLVHLVRTNGPRKQEVLASQLSAQTGHLSEVLGGKGKHWPEAWIKFIAQNYDPDRLVPQFVARWEGLEVRAPRRLTDAALVRAMHKWAAQHNGIGRETLREIEELALSEPETDEVAP